MKKTEEALPLDPNKLITSEIRSTIIGIICKRFPQIQKTNGDLISYVYFAMHKAVDTFKYKSSFRSYLIWKSVYNVIDQLRTEGLINRKYQSKNGRKRYTLLDDIATNSETNLFSDEVTEEVIYVDNVDACEFLLSKLSKKEQKIIKLRYFHGKKMKEIGKILSPAVSESTVSMWHKNIIESLQVFNDEAGYLDEADVQVTDQKQHFKRYLL